LTFGTIFVFLDNENCIYNLKTTGRILLEFYFVTKIL